MLAAFPLPILQGHLTTIFFLEASSILPDECLHVSHPPIFSCSPISRVLLRTLVLCCCLHYIVCPLGSEMLSITIVKQTTVSMVLGAQMGPKRHLLDSLTQDNISPAGKSVRQKCPTAASLPVQGSGEPRDPGLT